MMQNNYKKFYLGIPCLVILVYIFFKPGTIINADNIIIDAIPKSGSTYLAVALCNGLNYSRVQITLANAKQNNRFYTIPKFYATPKLLAKQHFSAPASDHKLGLGAPQIDILLLEKFTDKKVLHLRDPREVLLSLVHHVNLLKDQSHVLPIPPTEYYKLNLRDQIDWGIENFLPRIVIWIEEWLDFKDAEDHKTNGFKILITTYDELVSDELTLLHKILEFYNISIQNFNYTIIQKNQSVRFRKGDRHEWREVFTTEQRQRIKKIIPDSLLARFNWYIDTVAA